MAANTDLADSLTFPAEAIVALDASWQEFTLPGHEDGASANKSTGWRTVSVKVDGNAYISWDQTLADDGTPTGNEIQIGNSDGWLTWTSPVERRRQATSVFIAGRGGATPTAYVTCEGA